MRGNHTSKSLSAFTANTPLRSPINDRNQGSVGVSSVEKTFHSYPPTTVPNFRLFGYYTGQVTIKRYESEKLRTISSLEQSIVEKKCERSLQIKNAFRYNPSLYKYI